MIKTVSRTLRWRGELGCIALRLHRSRRRIRENPYIVQSLPFAKANPTNNG